MTEKNPILIGLALLLLGGAGYLLLAPRRTNNISPALQEEREGENEMMEKGDMMASPVAMDIKNFAFVQKELRIIQGTKVTWTNQDTVGHTVTSDKGVFESGLLKKGGSFSHTFSEKGTFSYHCAPHSNMTARVIVE
ncbi:MAG: multicopper oxidase type 3 [Parcubacteria group bacterium Gr01-1014_66]|nr:MAG: multicopper oxidase type 3 [Parcubacteria group bacterium Gr01-1014_66]